MFSLLQVSNSLLVVAQASAGDNKSVVGWVIVLILAAIFAAFVISILRTKPIDAAALASDGNGASSQDVVTEAKVEVERVVATVDSVEASSLAAKEIRVSTPEPVAPKVKGLKGKKKQQKKKINAQRGVTPIANQANSVAAKKDNDTAYQPRIAEYTPSLSAASPLTEGAMVDGTPVESSQSSDSTTDDVPVEPVRLASTYAINAMANKPRISAKTKESNEKKSQNKGVVQGFHKMDRYREPIRTVDAPISTPTAPRTELLSASVGGETEPVRKEERRERKPRREPAKPVQTDADGPRTLKDFLTKKPDEE
jgi:hypothetical protein